MQRVNRPVVGVEICFRLIDPCGQFPAFAVAARFMQIRALEECRHLSLNSPQYFGAVTHRVFNTKYAVI